MEPLFPNTQKGAKMLACTHPAFDGPVILFQNIIKTLHRSMNTLLSSLFSLLSSLFSSRTRPALSSTMAGG